MATVNPAAKQITPVFREVSKIDTSHLANTLWGYDGVEFLSTDVIFAKLGELGIDTDAHRFHDQAAAAGGCTVLRDNWFDQATNKDAKDIGFWTEFVLFSVPELWERLAADVKCWELIERHVYKVITASGNGKALPPVDGAPAIVAAANDLVAYIQSLPQPRRREDFSKVCTYYAYGTWLLGLIDEAIPDAGRREWATGIANFLVEVGEPKDVALASIRIAEMLASDGRHDEASDRAWAAFDQFPDDDFDVTLRLARLFMQVGNDDGAIQLWIDTMGSAPTIEEYEMASESLRPLMERAGRGNEMEGLRRIIRPLVDEFPPEPPPSLSPPVEAPKPPRSGPKIGRNDPCPCGSGKKYKKCCLGKAD